MIRVLPGVLALAMLAWGGCARAASGDVIVPNADQLKAIAAGTNDFAAMGRAGSLLRIQANASYNVALPSGALNAGARQQIAALVLQELGDHYDFIVVAPVMQVNLGEGIRGLHWQVHNDVQGIGRPLLDLRTQFGGAQRLKAVIDLDESILPVSFTSAEYDSLLDTLMHEVMHQWGSYVPLLVSGSPLATPSSHWSSRYDSNASVMFGARWQGLDGQRWRQVKIRDGFGPLDLYLAGFIPQSELPSTRYLLTDELQGGEFPQLGRTVQAEERWVTAQELVTALGPRVPDHGQAQRDFAAALVSLEPVGFPAAAADLDRLELLRGQAQNRFAALTGGRARLDLGIQIASLQPAAGSPTGVSSAAAPMPALDLAAATQFLLNRRDQDLWQDKTASRIPDSLRVLTALATDPAQGSTIAAARARLDGWNARTLEHLAALLRVPELAATRRSVLLQALVARQQSDGGFGLAGDHKSAILDTGLAVQAMTHARSAAPEAVPAGVIESAVGKLQAARDAALNCWGAHAGSCEFLSSVTAVTALATAGASAHGEALFRWQQPDGGFAGSGTATPFETALALNALSVSGMSADSRVRLGHAWLAAHQLADGSWGGSVGATAEALLFFRRDARPDLLVEGSIRLRPEQLVQGQATEVRFDVRNAGVQPAPASSLVVDVQPASGGQWRQLPGLDQSPPMGGGALAPLQLEWDTAALEPGDYRLRVRVDASGQLEELDETNNAAERVVNLASPPALPDLTVKYAQVELVPNVVTSVPQAVSVRFTVENLGLSAVGNATIRIHGFRFGELLPLRTISRPVAAQARVAVDESVQLTDPDVSRIVVLIDPDNAVAEAREDNNRAEAAIQRTATVDLAVLPADIGLPSAFRTGTPAEFAITLRNLGTSDSPIARLQVDVRRSDASTLRLADQDVQVAAGGSIQRLVPWIPDLAGNSAIRVRIDALDQVVEIDEGNNQAETAFEVVASSLPNLRAVPGSWQIAPDPALEGAAVQVGVTVVNDSAHAAPAFSVEFAAARTGSSDYQSLGSVRVAGGIPSGASQPVILQIPALSGPYPRQLVARIDVGDEVTESNEGDNLALQLLQVLSLPNLQLAAIDTRLTPAQPAPGASVRLTATLRNTGQQTVPGTVVELQRLATDGAPAAPLAPARQIQDLQPGEARVIEFDFIRPEGALRIELAADRANAIVEGREDDNRATLDLDNVDPDFYVTEPYFSPNGDGRADQTEIVARLTPPAAVRLRVLTSWGEEVLSYGNGSVVAQLGGVWDGRRPDGRRALDDRYEVRLESANGQLLKRLPLVLDTNRRPLVLAARDGKALVQPLDCEVSPHFDLAVGGHGLDFVVANATQGTAQGLYRYGFDGSARLLLRKSAFPGSYGLEPAAMLDESTVAVVASTSQGVQVATVDVGTGAILRPATAIGHGASAYLGRLLNGSLVFGSAQGIVGWDPVTGQSALWGVAEGEPHPGTDRVLLVTAPGGAMKLVGPTGVTAIAEQIPNVDGEIWRAARFSYSGVARAFYWSPGAQSLWRQSEQKVLRIDETSGAVTVIASSSTALANLAAGVSPSGRYLILTRGAEARATIHDLSAGTAVEIDLSDLVSTNVPPRHPDKPMGQGVFEFHWSPDETQVAARFEAYQDNEPVSIDKFEGSNIYVLGARGLLIEVATGQVHDLSDFKPRGWVEGELQLLGEQEGIALERGGERWPLLPPQSPIEIEEHFPYRSSGLSAVFRKIGFGGCPQPQVHALYNRGNGFAKLNSEYVEALRTLVVRASADDHNLAVYSLDFQPVTGGEWTEILSGTEPVDDQVIGTWSPPGPGRYRLRLRVVDRAGNVVNTTRDVVWFDNAEGLGWVEAGSRIFSPNGDGIQEQLRVSYEVRSAVEYDFIVESAEGAIVRSDRVAHPVPGAFEWHWNGRDQSGLLLPDGAYNVRFAGRVFPVVVDNAPPTVVVSENPPGSSACLPAGYILPVSLAGTHVVSAVDENLGRLVIESRPRDGSAPWTERDDYVHALFGLNPRPQEAREEELRIIASDRAGNKLASAIEMRQVSVLNARLERGNAIPNFTGLLPGRRNLVLTYDSSPSRLVLGLLARSLSGWHVEYRNDDLEWQSIPHTLINATDVPFHDNTCFAGEEIWIGIELPSLPEYTEFRLRQNSGSLDLKSNSVEARKWQRCLDGSMCPGGGGGSHELESTGRGTCDAVGVSAAALPLPWAMRPITAQWFDSRIGALVEIPMVEEQMGADDPLVGVDVTSLPYGEHLLRVEYANGAGHIRATVGHSPAVPPPPVVDRPQPGDRLCAGDLRAVTGSIDHPFIESIDAELIGGGYVGSTKRDWPPLLPRPDGSEGLSNPAPADWQIQVERQTLGDGPNTLRVRSSFCGRHSTWVERPVIVDADALVGSLRVGPSLDDLRHPTHWYNGSGVAGFRFAPSLGQKARFAVQSYEGIEATASVHRVGTRPALTAIGQTGEWTPIGPVVVELGRLGPTTGQLHWQWDGRDSAGQVVDGEFVVVVVYRDDCGHQRKDVAPVAVDDTPPQVQWLEPAAGSVVTLFQPLRARAQDELTVNVEFSYAALSGGGQWLPIGAEQTSARGVREFTKNWFSYVTPGTYRLRFKARDEVGLEGQTEIEVQVPERSPLTLAAALNNELISPNGDGVLESTVLQLSLSRAALVTVRVIDATGVTRRTLAESVALNGLQSLTWNGRDQAGTVVADGSYRVSLRVVDPAQPAHFEEAEFVVAVDNTPPLLAMRAPAGAFSNGRGALTLEVEDAHPQGVQVSSSPPIPGLLAQHDGGGLVELAQLDVVEEGSYTLGIQAQDRAGNRSQLSHAFTVDRSPPIVSIDAPAPASVLSRASGPIAVRSQIDDAHLENRALELRQGDSVVSAIASDSAATSGPWLASWAGTEADGDYVLRLTAADRSGNRGQVEVPLVLDNTPPVARIDAPLAGASVGASFAVTGSATDSNFDRFELDLAVPAQPPVFERVAQGSEAVADGLLATVLSPAIDGNYLLRLRVRDRAGHLSEVFREIRVDTQPPPAPTQLRVQRSGPRGARLDWTAPTPASDVAGYRLLRNAQVVAEPAALEFTDTQLSEGVHRWQVRAIDAAGNESPPSNQVSLAIDTTPPEVAIYSPMGGARVGGTLAIVGRAFSRDDFERWELRAVRAGQPAAVLASGTSAVLNAQLVQWNTLGYDGAVRLQIEARDIYNNVAAREIELTIDNQPPAAPVGLVASEAGASNVQLDWTPNTEADLRGYLVYRGARLLQGDPAGNPLLLAITAPAWLDEGVGDGNFQWRVQAIDTTGNLSAFSEPASLARSGRPPRVELIRPLDGERFDTRIPVRGRSADLDLAEVQFESRTEGASVWTPFGPLFPAPPFDSIFEPAPRAYGFYDLRARSLDLEGLSDPSPPIVRVEHRDLQAPPTPSGLRVMVDGDRAMLDWDPVSAPDLANYAVQRAAPGGEYATVAMVPAPTVAHADGSLADGDYRYRIRAVDTAGNQSPAAAPVNARVFSLEVEQPYTPTLQADVEWRVRSVVPGQSVAALQSASGTSTLPQQSAAAGQWLSMQTLLEPGLNTFTVRVHDGAGNRSKPAEARAWRSERPPAPTNVAAVVNAHQVNLSWQMPAYPRPVTFRVFRDGSPREPDVPQTPQAAFELLAQGAPRPLPRLIDGAPSSGDSVNLSGGGVNVLVQFAQPVIATGFELQLDAPQAAVSLAVEGEWLGNWVRLPSTLTEEPGKLTASLGQAYRSQQFRLRLSGADQPIYLRELVVRVRPTQGATSLQETLADGRYRYRVAAVNHDAFESAQSDPADVDVGDTTPPPAVVLSGQVTGADAQLQWTESTAPDLAAYRVLRGSTPIASITNLAERSYVDTGLPNGAYGYRVLAVDQVGNASASNQIVLTVEIATLPAPIGLAVEALPGGGALRLRWQPGAGSTPAYFGVLRSLTEAGPFEQIGDSEAPTFDDQGLVNGTRYFYRVRAYDVIGNASPDSNVASGVPVYADAPVITPVFHYPTRYGRSVVIPRPVSAIAGRGQPGSTVHVGTGTSAPRQAAIPTEALMRSYLTGGSDVLVSPDAGHVYSDAWLRPIDGGDPGIQLGSDCAPAQWLDADRLMRCSPTPSSARLEIYRLASATRAEVLDVPELRVFRLSDDGRRLLVVADLPGGPAGPELAWREQQPVGNWNRIAVSASDIDPRSVRIHGDNRWVIWYHLDGRVQVLDLQTGLLQLAPIRAVGVPSLSRRSAEALILGDSNAPGIHRLNLSNGTLAGVDLGASAPIAVAFNQDDTRLAVLEAGQWTLVRWPDGAPVASSAVNGGTSLTALATEEWAVQADIDLYVVQPPGVFRLSALELAFGDNIVAAIASAPGQLDSGPALPITLTVPGDGLADLAVRNQDLSALPNVGRPGATARIGARIRNAGSAPSATTSATLQVSTPSGQQMPLLSVAVPPLLSGAETVVAWQTPLLVDSGIYGLSVVVNGARVFQESSFSNNLASRTFTVNADGLPELALSVDRALLAPTETLHGSVAVVNGGAPFTGRLALRLLDDQQHLVVLLHEQVVQLTSPTAALSVPFDWTPGSVAAGRYRVVTELHDAAGALLRTRDAHVDVRAETLLWMTLDPGHQSVTLGSPIQLQARLRYVQGNTSVEDAELRSRLVGSNGLTVAENSRALGALTVGYDSTHPVAFATGTLPAGSYSLISEVWSGGLLAEAGAAVQLVHVNGTAAVSGAWQASDSALPAGSSASLQFEVRNTGAVALSDLPVRARARRQTTGSELATAEFTWSLAAGESRVGNIEIPASAMSIGAILLTLDVPSGPLARMLDVRSALVSDVAQPSVTPIRPANGAIVPGRFDAAVRVVDAHSSISQAELRIGAGAYQAMSPGSSFPGEFRFPVDAAEGPLTLQARARDAFGNLGVSASWSVTVDRTPPQISIQNVVEGGLYAVPVAPAIQVSDANLDATTILLDGQPYVSATPVASEGNRQLYVSATDRAGNRSQRSLRFVIDTTPPEIQFTFPSAGAVVAAATTPVILATEPSATVTLTLGAFSAQAIGDPAGVVSFAAVPLAEGANALQAVSVDAAGNASAPVTHTVHRSSATVGLFDGDLIPSSSASQPGPDLTGTAVVIYLGATPVGDIPARLSLVDQTSGQTMAQIQWTRAYAPAASVPQSYQFASGALSLGDYLLVLEARLTDAGGQQVWTVIAQEAIALADLSPPEVHLVRPAAGALLPADFPVEADVSDLYSSIDIVDLLLDQQPPAAMASGPAPRYAAQLSGIADGLHGIRVRARDSTGHERTEPSTARAITVDGTAPQITIAGIADGQLSNQPLVAMVTVTDEHPASTEVLLDGSVYAPGSPINAEGTHTLRVRATDGAGNQSSRELRFTIDLTPPDLLITQPGANSATPLSHLPVVAQTEAGIEVELLNQAVPWVAVSDAQGVARFAAVWLAPGENLLELRARDRAGNLSLIRSVRITRLTNNTAPIEAAMQHPGSVPHGQLLAGVLLVTSTIPNSPHTDELRLDVRSPSLTLLARLEWSQPLQQGQAVELPFSHATSDWPATRVRLQLSWRRLTQPDAPFVLIAATEADIRDEVPPTLLVMDPTPGSTVPDPIPVRVQASDALTGIDEVSARVDDESWIELAPGPAPGEWQGSLPATGLGLRQLWFRATDGAGNTRTQGPIAVCREGSATWPGFADGFETPAGGSGFRGFESQSCVAAAKTLQRMLDWFRHDADPKAEARKERLP